MDVLVELCLQNHLNPSHHALELWTPEALQPLSFKPNTPVGSLNVHTVLLKEKVPEERAKPGPPKAPEVSGRPGLPGTRGPLRDHGDARRAVGEGPPRCQAKG